MYYKYVISRSLPIYCSCRMRKALSLAATRGLAVHAKVTSPFRLSWSTPSQVGGNACDNTLRERTSSM